MTTTQENLKRLVQDHKIQAGIGLAVAMNVMHWHGDRNRTDERIWKVGEIIDLLTYEKRILISDPDGVLSCKGAPYMGISGDRPHKLLRIVSRVAYIGAVVILAANAVDIQRQLREPEKESEKAHDPIIDNPHLAEMQKRINGAYQSSAFPW